MNSFRIERKASYRSGDGFETGTAGLTRKKWCFQDTFLEAGGHDNGSWYRREQASCAPLKLDWGSCTVYHLSLGLLLVEVADGLLDRLYVFSKDSKKEVATKKQ